MGFRLIVLLSLLGVAGSDPTSLVQRLGSPKYVDREEASAAIEKLGRDALPSLKTARTGPDAEIRSRATELVERIENELMIRPTMVTLDFRDEPLSQVIAKLAERGKLSFTVPPALRTRRINLVREQPVTFWQAVELIGQAAGMELAEGGAGVGYSTMNVRPISLTFVTIPANAKIAPASASGPFRISLMNLHLRKERDYTGANGNLPWIPGMGARPEFRGAGFPRPGGAVLPEFTVTLQVTAEPRMNVAMNGPARLVEAVDDLGNSLLESSAPGNGFVHNSGYSGFETPGSSAFPLSLNLKYPEHPGKRIRRLRGVVPLAVTSRKDDPLVVPLVAAKGKTYQNAEAAVIVNEVKSDPNTHQLTIELTIQPRQPIDPMLGFGQNLMVRSAGASQNPLEIVDSQGRLIPQWFVSSQIASPEGVRVSIRVTSGLFTSPATHLRYYETSRANTDAEFEFVDVEMP
jgi:hypothetical protein